jgi:uncharacterized membrane protein
MEVIFEFIAEIIFRFLMGLIFRPIFIGIGIIIQYVKNLGRKSFKEIYKEDKDELALKPIIFLAQCFALIIMIALLVFIGLLFYSMFEK